MTSSRQPASNRTAIRGIALALVALVLIGYGRTGSGDFDFVNIDDEDYVVANPHVTGGITLDNLRWAATAFHSYNWHPLTWISLQLDSQLFGTTAGVYHRTNVLLHAANVVLLFWLLRRLSGALWPSALVAALFAIHPTHVESVAWVAERKDVLSALFWLLTIAAYARYAEQPGVGRYLLVVVAFALGLMAKPMLATLPFVLLLLDYWPLRRWPAEETRTTPYIPASLPRLLAEKVPLLCLVILSVLLTLRAQEGLVQSLEHFPVSLRVANALVSYVKYIGMTLCPIDLAVYYPYPGRSLPSWQWLGAAGLLAGLSAVLLWAGRRRRYLTVGWLWYLGTMVPVIGLVQVSNQALADRYTYIPTMGLFIMLAWGLADFCAGLRDRVALAGVLTGGVLALFLVLTIQQVQHWRDSEALWRHALEVSGSSASAHEGLGLALARKGKLEEAVKHLDASSRLDPNVARVQGNLGMALAQLGELDAASVCLERAVQLEPDSAKSRLHLGQVREQQGRYEEAVREFKAALRIDSNSTEARLGLAGALAGQGAFDQAREVYETLLRADPDSALLHDELGRLLKRQGKLKEAVACYDRALELQPEFHTAWNNKGAALEAMNEFARAVDCYRHAIELEPNQMIYRVNLAYALEENGQHEASITQYEVANRLQPNWQQLAFAEAWALATHPDPKRRNGRQALRSARLVCQASRYQLPEGLEALAAAHAELGQFDQAATWEKKALALLSEGSAAGTVEAARQRVRLYESRQPYHEPPGQSTQR